MTNKTLDLAAAAAAIAATGPDMNKVVKGGGDYKPPPAGVAMVRFVGYIEVGQHTMKGLQNKPDRDEDQAILVFELHGKAYEKEGEPHRIGITLNKSQNEKAHFFKLFTRMNYQGKATHFSQLLGQGFLATVVHSEPNKDGKVFARLKDDSGYTIRPPRIEDPLSGEVKEVPVPPAKSSIRIFVWNAPAEFIGPMWDSLFIDGAFDDGRTKNVFQDKIKSAKNFANSPIFQHLQSGGVKMDLGAKVEAGPVNAGANDDPLAGM